MSYIIHDYFYTHTYIHRNTQNNIAYYTVLMTYCDVILCTCIPTRPIRMSVVPLSSKKGCICNKLCLD